MNNDPQNDPPTEDWPSPLHRSPGEWVGPYRILGNCRTRSGFASVCRAERPGTDGRSFAIKIFDPEAVDAGFVERCQEDLRALRGVRHRGVVEVDEVGLDATGCVYLAMEYIEGEPITRHCNARKLGIAARLELFLGVCEAFARAHARGVLHRDVAPDRIIVDARGARPEPRVVGFGISRCLPGPLDGKVVREECKVLFRHPTLEYLGPDALDAPSRWEAHSDVHGLGILLYELLAGVPPRDRHELGVDLVSEFTRILRSEQPPSPSTRLSALMARDPALARRIGEERGIDPKHLAKVLHRELEWIPMKAIQPDRTRRYQSAEELAHDVERYLDGVPLAAAPRSWWYQLSKSIRRAFGRGSRRPRPLR
jgi:eukaryotic-like serine/threonine-protein kinase